MVKLPSTLKEVMLEIDVSKHLCDALKRGGSRDALRYKIETDLKRKLARLEHQYKELRRMEIQEEHGRKFWKQRGRRKRG